MSGQSAAKLVRIAPRHSTGASANSMVRPHLAIMELVQRYGVRCVILPEVSASEIGVCPVGFELELHGTHEQSGEHPARNCERCRRVYAALRVIAEWIFPCEERPSTCEIEVQSPFVTSSPSSAQRASVKLTFRVVRRAGRDPIVCNCEPHCLEKIEERLKALGATGLDS